MRRRPALKNTIAAGRLVGYARVSTEDQGTDPQEDELRAAGCDVIYRERASGNARARPELARLLVQIQPGDVLIVVRLDRLARSVSHLLETIEVLDDKSAHFRSLRDPIDTSTAQGMFSLQVLGAVAQLERALISERTKAGIAAARARGREPGNPGLRRGDKNAIAKTAAARNRRHMADLIASIDSWMPTVRRMRPDRSWEDIVRVLNATAVKFWTPERLRRSVKHLVRERLADKELLKRAPIRRQDNRLLTLVAGIALASPDMSLRDIAAQLEAMHERTPRGGYRWTASSVKNLLDRARREGLISSPSEPTPISRGLSLR
jgi:DNA invertase Pin-like site-specific DNA recombinase